MKVAIVGLGYWGQNLIRNFSSLDGCSVAYACDVRAESLSSLSKKFPSVKCTSSYNEVLNDKSVDAVVIATPVFSHFELARMALLAQKHVLVEKPLSSNYQQASELFELSQRSNRILMVDHTFLYTSAVQKMKKLLVEGTIGKVKYFDSTRINLGLFQPDINVLWDLAPHDISILNYLIDEEPYSVNATGVSHTKNGIENIAYMTVNYNSGFIAHFNCSWTSPVKIRMMLIGGDEKMMVYNDLEPTEKIRIYDTGYNHKADDDKTRIMVDYRVGDVFIPKLELKEALFGMASDFVNSIKENRSPVSDYNSAVSVIKILEAAQFSIKNRGKEILL
ncbi:MAG: Gfo/Idh/MocA family protein [Bacteroidota bacterium]|jgi:predicted dehydrogenase